MKNQIKVLLLSAMVLSFQNSFSQKKKLGQKSKPKTETIKGDPQPDVMLVSDAPVMAEESPVSISEVRSDGNYGRYATEKINDETIWFYDKYNSNYKFGIKKRDQVLLPALFERKTYPAVSDNSSFPMGIGKNYGLYNVEKEIWEIPMIYYSLDHIGNDIFSARTKNGYYGVISRNNKVLIPFKWAEISSISGVENYFILQDKKTNLRGLYSLLNGKFVIPCEYQYIQTVDKSNYFKVDNEKGSNLVSIDNKPKFKKWYTQINSVSSSKNFIVKLNDKMGIIDENENIVLPIEYKDIKTYPYNDGSFLAVNKEGKYGCVLINGKISLPFEYDQINTSYSNNLKTTKNNKCGLIQVNSGTPYEIVTCEYDNINIENETFIVEKNGLFGMLDSFGKLIAPCEYESIDKVVSKNNNYSSNFVFIAKKDKKFVLLDKNAQQISAAAYSNISPVTFLNKNGSYYDESKFSYLMFQNNNKAGLLDMLGQQVMESNYEEIIGENNNLLLVKQKGKIGVYNLLTKTETIPCVYDQIVLDPNGNYGVKGKEIYSIDLNDNTKTVKL
ncbi:WG repeat-containing protein [Flavobacterium marginilacus]|uniref:WG repeat-containing protein n=1 Tax=Flavobacterium marginilacus TaxID=3003256 RepID=UPI00248DA56A|nr:WG repeat-containing protein [Flavobacterium marginilacus]